MEITEKSCYYPPPTEPRRLLEITVGERKNSATTPPPPLNRVGSWRSRKRLKKFNNLNFNLAALHTAKRMCPTEPCTTGETPRARTRAKVVISGSTFSNADHGPWLVYHELMKAEMATATATRVSTRQPRPSSLINDVLCETWLLVLYDSLQQYCHKHVPVPSEVATSGFINQTYLKCFL